MGPADHGPNSTNRHQPPQPPPTSTILHQPPRRAHRKMIHRTPMVAASTTESTMLSWRRPPPGTGIAVASGVPYVRPAVLTSGGGGVAELTAPRMPAHRTNNRAAKCRTVIAG